MAFDDVTGEYIPDFYWNDQRYQDDEPAPPVTPTATSQAAYEMPRPEGFDPNDPSTWGGDSTRDTSRYWQFPGGDPLEWAQSLFSQLPPTQDSLIAIYNALKSAGVNVERPTNATGTSADKLKINGKMYDFIKNVGGSDAAWQLGEEGSGGGETVTGPTPDSARFGGDGGIDPAYLAPWTQAPPQAPSAPVFTPPQPYQPPSYPQIPAYQAPPPFSYGGFEAPSPFQAPDPFQFEAFDVPTLEEAQQQPGYQFAVEQGLKALQQSAAARGILRTGGTLKDLINYGQAAGQQNYQNVFNNDLAAYSTNQGNKLNAYQLNFENALNAYQGNYGNALNAYKTNYDTAIGQYATNYGVGRDAYSTNTQNAKDAYASLYQGSQDAYNSLYQGAQDQFNSIAAKNASDYQRAMDRFNSQYQIYRNNQSDPFQKQLSLAQLGAQTAGVS